MGYERGCFFCVKSLSARRAWIEIPHTSHDFPAPKVALRKESVDRNTSRAKTVAAEVGVALRKESVDRNDQQHLLDKTHRRSLSARRAWIEIIDDLEPSSTRKVALRKESVDRNSD